MTASKYSPADYTDSNTPKFGYRCLYSQSSTDYVTASNSHGTFDINSSGPYTFEVFIQPKDSSAGNIISFVSGNSDVLTLSITTSRTFKITCSAWSLSLTGTVTAGLSTWVHVRAVINAGDIFLYVNNVQDAHTTITSGLSLKVTAIRVGGSHAFLDEFCFMNKAASASVTVPYQGTLDITKAGGFGSGRDGTVNVDSASTVSVNMFGKVSKADGLAFTANWETSTLCSSIKAGDEVMFLVFHKGNSSPDDLIGRFAFRNITGVSGNSFTVDKSVTEEFDMSDAFSKCYVYAYKIPHFSSFTFTGTLLSSGHVTAFRCTGDVHWNGQCGDYRPISLEAYRGSHQMCHSDIPDRMTPTHNILVFCGGTFTAPSTASIGSVGTAAGQASPGYGGKRGDESVMIGTHSANRGANILIAARKLAIDSAALDYGGWSYGYSGCCYLAGELV